MAEVRICNNCNQHNVVSLMECQQCGYDLSMVIPVDEESISQEQMSPTADNSDDASGWGLALTDESEGIIRIRDTTIVGREDSLFSKILDNSNFTSRKHAQLFVVDDKLCLIDASTNGTFVNGNRIQKLETVVLCEGDEVRFADVVFKVVR